MKVLGDKAERGLEEHIAKMLAELALAADWGDYCLRKGRLEGARALWALVGELAKE